MRLLWIILILRGGSRGVGGLFEILGSRSEAMVEVCCCFMEL